MALRATVPLPTRIIGFFASVTMTMSWNIRPKVGASMFTRSIKGLHRSIERYLTCVYKISGLNTPGPAPISIQVTNRDSWRRLEEYSNLITPAPKYDCPANERARHYRSFHRRWYHILAGSKNDNIIQATHSTFDFIGERKHPNECNGDLHAPKSWLTRVRHPAIATSMA